MRSRDFIQLLNKLSLFIKHDGGHPSLVLIDNWGLDTLNQQNRNDLLEIIEDQHGNGASLINSQLPTHH